jgi:hypothetical protein
MVRKCTTLDIEYQYAPPSRTAEAPECVAGDTASQDDDAPPVDFEGMDICEPHLARADLP